MQGGELYERFEIPNALLGGSLREFLFEYNDYLKAKMIRFRNALKTVFAMSND